MIRIYLLIIILSLILSLQIVGQNVHKFRLTSGEVISGQKINETDSGFLISTAKRDTIFLKTDQVIDQWKSIHVIVEEQSEKSKSRDLNQFTEDSPYFLQAKHLEEKYKNRIATKYAATGHYRPLKQGSTIYENNLLLFNQLLISPGEYVNIGIGGTVSFGMELVCWITPKATIPLNDFLSVGVGSTIVSYGQLFSRENRNIQSYEATYFGGFTLGTPYNHVTLNLSRGYNNFILPIESDLFRRDEFIFQANGIYRIGNRLSIMAETVFFDEEVLVIPALKSHFKNCELNYGLVLNSYVYFLYLGVQVHLIKP